jgi:hypothetical protein
MGTRGARQRFVRGQRHPLKTASAEPGFGGFCVVEIYLILVEDGCVAHGGKFACAEE